MKKILTSFMNLSTGEGSRIAYTYSEVDESTGSIISQNNKGNFLVMNDDVQKNLDSVKDYIKRAGLQCACSALVKGVVGK